MNGIHWRWSANPNILQLVLKRIQNIPLEQAALKTNDTFLPLYTKPSTEWGENRVQNKKPALVTRLPARRPPELRVRTPTEDAGQRWGGKYR